jgi:hypothetical protein
MSMLATNLLDDQLDGGNPSCLPMHILTVQRR